MICKRKKLMQTKDFIKYTKDKRIVLNSWYENTNYLVYEF